MKPATDQAKHFAAGTKIAADRTVHQIEELLDTYGASAFAYGKQAGRAMLSFELGGKRYRLELALPDVNDPELMLQARQLTKQARRAAPRTLAAAYTVIINQRWRALYQVIQAKLIAVTEEITTFENEFSWFVVLPSGQTLGEAIGPHIDRVYTTGQIPPILPGLTAAPHILGLPEPELDEE